MEKIKNVFLKIVKCRILYYIAIAMAFIAIYYCDLKVKITEMNVEGNYLKFYLLAAFTSAIVSLILIFIVPKLFKKLKPHLVYCIIALVLGGMYVVAIPLCAQSDEPAHIYRAYQIAEGKLIPNIIESRPADYLPNGLVKMVNIMTTSKIEHKKYYNVKEMMQIDLDENNTELVEMKSSYSPINYFPHAIGMKIGMIFNMNPYWICMLGKIVSLIFAVALFTLGIKKMPKHKLFAIIVLLSPVALSYAAGYSADTITVAVSFLLISYVYHYIETKEKISKKDQIIIAVLAMCVAICKTVYAPIVGIILLLPKESFNTKKEKWIKIFIGIALGIFASLVWLKLTEIEGVTNTESLYGNDWIKKNPLGYLVVLARTTFNDFYGLIKNVFCGNYLCHNQINPYDIVSFTYMLIVGLAVFNDENNKDKKINKIFRNIIVFGIFALIYVLICTAMYFYNTVYRNPVIIGVQGRYLLPIVLLIPIVANYKKWSIDYYKLTSVAILLNATVYLTMITKFIV